jgi:CRISPR/Cas system-associated exonuclease Cas4 (RecB family)
MTRARTECGISIEIPHLSHSRINRYLHCPEQYRLYYVEGLRTRVPAANLIFGKTMHEALAAFFRTKADPAAFFARAWDSLRGVELTYGQYDSWDKLAVSGETLLTRFVTDEAPRVTAIEAVEEAFSVTVTSFGVPLVGVVDLVAAFEGKRTVVDFKTAARDYEEHAVVLNDQLTAYAVARPDAEQVALCVFVKGRVPRIEWHLARRQPADLVAYLQKAEIVVQAITARHFYKRPGWWCSSCDYLPVCLGDFQMVHEKLVPMGRSEAAA